MPQLEITYRRSSVGRSDRQKRTIRALGLTKLHQTVLHPDNASVRGMIDSVQHLVSWREVEEESK